MRLVCVHHIVVTMSVLKCSGHSSSCLLMLCFCSFSTLYQLNPNSRFEYDVDGKRTTLERDQFEAALKKPGQNFDVLTVMDDSNLRGPKDVEVAIRLLGCGRDCAFSITHFFWA